MRFSKTKQTESVGGEQIWGLIFLAVIHKRILFLESNFFLSTHSEGIHIVEIWCMFVLLLKDLGIKRRPLCSLFPSGELLQHSLASFEMETGRK